MIVSCTEALQYHPWYIGRMTDREKPRQPYPRSITPISSPTLNALRELSVQVDGLAQDVRATRAEVGELRSLVVGDQAPRVTALERTAAQKAGTVALLSGKYGLLVLGGFGIVAELLKSWKPSLSGPIDTLKQLLSGQ